MAANTSRTPWWNASRLFAFGLAFISAGNLMFATSVQAAGLIVDVVGVAIWVIAGALLLSGRGALVQTAPQPGRNRLWALVASPRVLTGGAFVLLGAAVAVVLELLR